MDITGKKVTLHDMCLRDGMHAKRHQISPEQMGAVASALDEAGVPLIEVTHGDGLGGASVNYGFPAASDEEYLRAVVPKMKNAKISALLLPGIGTVEHLHMVKDCGVHTVRVATHCTEADVSEQHISSARKNGIRYGRFSHDGAHGWAGRNPRAGEIDGILRCQLHLLHRFCGLHVARRRHRAHRFTPGRTQTRNRTGISRPPQSGHGRRQFTGCGGRRCEPYRWVRGGLGRRCGQYTA